MTTVSPDASGTTTLTIQGRIDRAGGPTSGFDYLRIILAVAVLAWHSVRTSYGAAYETEVLRGWLHAPVALVLPMFFALSGFLVCGSLFKTKSLIVFVGHRALRLLPALAVEICLSALILGPLLTTLPLQDYFAGAEFRHYFLNILGDIHYELPGLFAANPYPNTVNTSLWTIPYELECYIALMLFAAVGLLRRRVMLTGLVLAGGVGFAALLLHRPGGVAEAMLSVAPGKLLVLSFVSGLAMYLWRERLPSSTFLTLGAGLVSLAMLARPETMFLAPLPAAYFTVGLGVTTPRKIPVLMSGDYSYGVYLFAFPIQQTYSALFPAGRIWWLNTLVALACSLAYAFFSWHVIEAPVLRTRRTVIGAMERGVRRVVRLLPWGGNDAARPDLRFEARIRD